MNVSLKMKQKYLEKLKKTKKIKNVSMFHINLYTLYSEQALIKEALIYKGGCVLKYVKQ
jgi:hypothetical protein